MGAIRAPRCARSGALTTHGADPALKRLDDHTQRLGTSSSLRCDLLELRDPGIDGSGSAGISRGQVPEPAARCFHLVVGCGGRFLRIPARLFGADLRLPGEALRPGETPLGLGDLALDHRHLTCSERLGDEGPPPGTAGEKGQRRFR